MQKRHLTKSNKPIRMAKSMKHGVNSQHIRNTGELPQHGKEHIQKPTANIFNDEKPETFLLRSVIREKCFLSPFLLTTN